MLYPPGSEAVIAVPLVAVIQGDGRATGALLAATEDGSKKENRMIAGSQTLGETEDPFAFLYPYEFVLLTTFRASGVGVPTAMWFAHEQGKLYMVTGRKSGKIKRIRHTRRVFLAPCDLIGNVLGPQIEAFAHELPDAHHAHADALLARKYGVAYEGDSSGEGVEEVEETFLELVSRPRSLRREEK